MKSKKIKQILKDNAKAMDVPDVWDNIKTADLTIILDAAPAKNRSKRSKSIKKKLAWGGGLISFATAFVLILIFVISPLNFSRSALRLMSGAYVDMNDISAFAIAQSTTATTNSLTTATAHTSTAFTNFGYTPIHAHANTNTQSSLVSFDENGNISEVVFRRNNDTIQQSRVGNLSNVYVCRQFTFMTFDNTNLQGISSVAIAGVRNRRGTLEQAFVIHHDSGKIFALNDFSPNADSIRFDIINGLVYIVDDYSQGWYKMDVDADYNLNFTRLNENPNLEILEGFRDRHGNAFMFNPSVNQVTTTARFLTKGDYSWFGSSDGFLIRVDRRANDTVDIEKFNENGEWVAVPNDAVMNLRLIGDKGWSGIRTAVVYNGNLFYLGHGELVVVGGYSFWLSGRDWQIEQRRLYRLDFGLVAMTGNWLNINDIFATQMLGDYYVSIREGQLVVTVHGAMQTNIYSVFFDGAEFYMLPYQAMIFGGRPVVSIRPIN